MEYKARLDNYALPGLGSLRIRECSALAPQFGVSATGGLVPCRPTTFRVGPPVRDAASQRDPDARCVPGSPGTQRPRAGLPPGSAGRCPVVMLGRPHSGHVGGYVALVLFPHALGRGGVTASRASGDRLTPVLGWRVDSGDRGRRLGHDVLLRGASTRRCRSSVVVSHWGGARRGTTEGFADVAPAHLASTGYSWRSTPLRSRRPGRHRADAGRQPGTPARRPREAAGPGGDDRGAADHTLGTTSVATGTPTAVGVHHAAGWVARWLGVPVVAGLGGSLATREAGALASRGSAHS